MNLPTRIINNAIGGVAFSSLARLQNDPVRLKSYFLKGYSLVVAITLPATIACAVFADDHRPGHARAAMGRGPRPSFRLLAPTILVFGMINPTAWLLQSMGLQERSLKIALVLAPLSLLVFCWAALWPERRGAFLLNR